MPNETLQVLLVEDDQENLDLLLQTLPSSIAGANLVYDPFSNFDAAIGQSQKHRYDLIVTDIYRNRNHEKSPVNSEDALATNIVTAIRGKRFCPVIAFTDGSDPGTFEKTPFITIVDKSGGDLALIAEMERMIKTGIPVIARRLYDDLEKSSKSYLWDFLERHWEQLQGDGVTEPHALERIIRRRASIQLGRLEQHGTTEVERVEAAEFYIWPSISGATLRLGEILKERHSGDVRVVLTPHCYLKVQTGDSKPRADYVLTVKTETVPDLFAKYKLKGDDAQKKDSLRRRLESPAGFGQPSGRYWFLPGFLTLPDSYCDLLQMESVPATEIGEGQRFERIAVLDTPFAEALQTCFTRFYSAVGLSTLDPERFSHLLPGEK